MNNKQQKPPKILIAEKPSAIAKREQQQLEQQQQEVRTLADKKEELKQKRLKAEKRKTDILQYITIALLLAIVAFLLIFNGNDEAKEINSSQPIALPTQRPTLTPTPLATFVVNPEQTKILATLEYYASVTPTPIIITTPLVDLPRIQTQGTVIQPILTPMR